METFREEHYEVEVHLSGKDWVKYGEGVETKESAEGICESLHFLAACDPSIIGIRIIRCTTVREVVES